MEAPNVDRSINEAPMPDIDLKVVTLPGLVLLGTVEEGQEGVLHNPRILTILDGGKRIQLSPLPGTPPFVRYTGEVLAYDMPKREGVVYKLYAQVTSAEVDPNHPNYVGPAIS